MPYRPAADTFATSRWHTGHVHSEQRASPGTNQYTRQRQTKTPTIQVNLAVPLDDDLVLDALAGSPNSPPQLLRQLSRRRTASPTLRIRLALNPACPPALLRQLAADPDYHVRNAVVRNPCCPPRLLTQAHHQDPGWDILIAGNPCCPPRLLTQLARSGEPTVQIAVARHPRCPPPTIQHLAGEMAVDDRIG